MTIQKVDRKIFTITLFCFIILGLFSEINAQKTFNGSRSLVSQADVNFFGSINYTEITGTLEIRGGDITSLAPLPQLPLLVVVLK